MKKYFLSLLLISTIFSQHIVKLKETSLASKPLRGKVEIVEADKTIKLKTSNGMKFLNISDVKEVLKNNGTIIWSFEEYNNRIKSEASKVASESLCEKNKNTKLLFVNLKNDVFGISDELYSQYNSTCFIMVDNYAILGIFDKNKLNRKDINDFHLMEAAKELGADLIISGDAYQYTVPFKYAPTTSDVNTVLSPVDDDNSFTNISRQLMGAVAVYGQKKDRAVAIKNAGVYVNISLFVIDVKTGGKKFLMKNRTILKVG